MLSFSKLCGTIGHVQVDYVALPSAFGRTFVCLICFVRRTIWNRRDDALFLFDAPPSQKKWLQQIRRLHGRKFMLLFAPFPSAYHAVPKYEELLY